MPLQVNDRPRHRLDFVLEFGSSYHAESRIFERMGITPKEAVGFLNSGRGIVMYSPVSDKGGRGYVLVYPDRAKNFFIFVFCLDLNGRCVLITVLTREQYEESIGRKILMSFRKRAVRCACSPFGYDEWLAEELLSDPGSASLSDLRKMRYRLHVEYFDENDQLKIARLRALPDVFSNPTTWTLETMLEQDGFADWFRNNLEHHQVNIGRVVSIHRVRPGEDSILVAMSQ